MTSLCYETKRNDHCEFPALMCATQAGHTSLVQSLLDAGADVNCSSPSDHVNARTAQRTVDSNDWCLSITSVRQ